MTVRHRDEIDQAKADMLKTVRTAVRLRHALNADNELNELLPIVEKRFDKSVAQGELPDPREFADAY